VDQLPSCGPGPGARDLINSGALGRMARLTRCSARPRAAASHHRPRPSMPAPSPIYGHRRLRPPATSSFLPADRPKQRGLDPSKGGGRAHPGALCLDPIAPGAGLPVRCAAVVVAPAQLTSSCSRLLNPEPPPSRWTLRLAFAPADKVMQWPNDYEKEVFNAMWPTVGNNRCHASELTVRFPSGGNPGAATAAGDHMAG